MNSNTYSLSIGKNEIIDIAEDKKYLIGYLTAREPLDSIAPKINDMRSLYPDVFKKIISDCI
ncbi:MAG: hypothetical protein LBS81_00150 [Endomicrobium sp.]|jgi:hypothetical protein|nr:hypothetical protein [Endomicrobium sp.]